MGGRYRRIGLVDLPPRKRITRAGKSALLKRDDRKCGIHMGGCRGQIQYRSECEVDHIVPVVLYNSLASEPRVFDNPWNYQPMHTACHKTKADRLRGRELRELEAAVTVGANTPDDWPRFECQCHYLHIFGSDLFVFTRGPIDTGNHLLYPGVVRDFGNEARQDGILVPGQWTGPGRIPARGFSNMDNNVRGFILPSFSPKRVPGFNILEAQRVGLPGPKYVYIDEKGYMTPVNDPPRLRVTLQGRPPEGRTDR